MSDEILTVGQRWERGEAHDPRSIEIAKGIAEVDAEQCSDSFCWKFGGDGDNGETLLYALDVFFARRDAARPPAARSSQPCMNSCRFILSEKDWCGACRANGETT